MRGLQLPDDEQTRYLVVGGWNVLLGYGMFLVTLALLGSPLHALATSPIPFLTLVGRNYFVVGSWVGWLLVVLLDSLAMSHLAYRSTGKALAQIRRAYFVYLPAQVLNVVLLWMSVRFLGLSPLVGYPVVIAVTAAMSYVAHAYFAFRAPLVVGEIPPADFLRDHGVADTLGALWGHGMRASLGMAGDVVHLPATVVLARRRGIKPYVFAGEDYLHASAGIRAWHHAIHELSERGMLAYSLNAVNPEWHERRITHVGYWFLCAMSDPIVIYGDPTRGNPLKAERVVRWVGMPRDYYGNDSEFSDSDLVYAWSKQFYDTDRILTIDIIERELFNAENLPEKGIECAYLGKAELRGVQELPQTFGMTHITRFPLWPPTRRELADLLRRTSVLYTYDDCTMIIDEARLCGCEVILLPEGVRYTNGNTAGRLTQQEYEAQLTRFIDETQRGWQP
jgi:putative flippase GtrA